jgi:hypothetical protein
MAMKAASHYVVIPAKAGIHDRCNASLGSAGTCPRHPSPHIGARGSRLSPG